MKKYAVAIVAMVVFAGGCVSSPSGDGYKYSNPRGVSPVIYNSQGTVPNPVPGILDQAVSLGRTEISGAIAKEVNQAIKGVFK